MTESSRIECLDGLRAAAALWVVVGHCLILTGWHIPVLGDPALGVDLFIMLSGFLMVFHYQLRRDREPWHSPATWLRFWTRRYFRIAPLFYVMLFLALALGPLLYEARMSIDSFLQRVPQASDRFLDDSLKNVLAHLSFLFGLSPNYAYRTPLPDWSLGLEMQFYAVFPALMLLVSRFGWFWSVICVATLGGIAALLLSAMSIHYPMPSFLPLKIQVFLCGMLLAGALDKARPRPLLHLALAMALAAIPVGDGYGFSKFLIREALVMAFFALVLYRMLPGAASALARKIAVALGGGLFHVLGELSYSIYLSHLLVLQPVAAFVLARFGNDMDPPFRFAVVFLIVLPVVCALSWITYKVIEMPGQTLGRVSLRSFARKSALQSSAAE
ncbi:acyltransferase [Mesorhizobium sp. MSK_1335]|uniref:Acyltransferase n=1 Tax=Mesorhizobium montanum TaxID=3072323 RepID=A0ABU4ZVF9_9HYPH|nr:acyltransferase [Mesorhizobium sp. MSK_1335]MDX8527936.1 acyltransferase [Mesorhizobium sp. MSK_1335]